MANSDPVPGLAGPDRQPGGQVGLAGPRRAEEHHVVLRGDEVEGAQVRDHLAFQAAGVVEVEVLQGLAGREPGGPDAALAAVGLAGGDLPLQAGDQELLMGPGLGAGPLGQPGDRLAQRRGLQRPGQERDLRGGVPGGRLRGGHHATPPSGAERGVVVGQARTWTSASRGGRRTVTRWRRIALAAARCAGSVMVWCQAQIRSWSATTWPSQQHADPVQVRGDLDPPADHGRVHRVVVGVQPDVVIAGQPR